MAAQGQHLFKLYANPFQIYLGIDIGQNNGNGVHNFEVETLERFCKNIGISNETHKIDILKQLIQCLRRLRRLRQQSITCPQLSSSQICYLGSQLPLVEHVPDYDEGMDDIHSLANIYCSVLTNKKWQNYSEELPMEDIQCSDPDIALDILRVMTIVNSTPNIEDVFRHPFYWSDFAKVNFVCSAFDYIYYEIKKEKKTKQRILTQDEIKIILDGFNMHEVRNVIPNGNWMAALKLTMRDIERGNENNENVMIGENVIINIAPKVTSIGNSVFELMRFFRNRYTHHVEDVDDIKNAFGGYPAGYLNFFTSRFPNFFMHVYRNMKNCVCREDNRGEFF